MPEAPGVTGSVRAGSLACKAGRSQAYPLELEKATESSIDAGTCRLCTLARGSDNLLAKDKDPPLSRSC